MTERRRAPKAERQRKVPAETAEGDRHGQYDDRHDEEQKRWRILIPIAKDAGLSNSAGYRHSRNRSGAHDERYPRCRRPRRTTSSPYDGSAPDQRDIK